MPRFPAKKRAPARARTARTGDVPRAGRRAATGGPTGASPRPGRGPSPRRSAPAAGAEQVVGGRPESAPPAPPTLTEEEQIESAKYLPRDLPRRVFEEERFLFPESYGRHRIRLLIKDPDWLFAHWDVDPRVFESLRGSLGERAAALARLTLRVSDIANGGSTVVLLPYGARSWYVRTDRRRRSYRAELGLTLPSGEFRPLAESNVVMTPPVGPAARRAKRRVRYDPVHPPGAELAAESPASAPSVGTWTPGPAAQPPAEPGEPGEPPSTEIGGASDIFRR